MSDTNTVVDNASDVLSKLKQLSNNAKLQILAEYIGYKDLPVDIDTFIHDDYYLGSTCGINPDTGMHSIRRVWRDALSQVYPNPIVTKSFVANSGAIGTGKSTMAKICLLYDIYKICMLKNAPAYFGLIQKFFHFKIFNLIKWKADQMVDELYDWINASQYFQEQKRDMHSIFQWIRISGASRMEDIISDDVVSIIYSEMNFIRDFDKATLLIDQGISRIESRFQKGIGLFNHIILDSSDTTVDAPVPYFLRHHPRAPETLVFKYAVWDAIPQYYYHKRNPNRSESDLEYSTAIDKYKYLRSFKVYKGDAEILPCVVEDDVDTSTMDPDRFMEVPYELYPDFIANIELALNEKAGVAVEMTGLYFKPMYVVPQMVNDMEGLPEVITIDFFGPESYIPYFENLVSKLPKDRCIYGRLDLGLVSDRAGFAIGYIEDLGANNRDGLLTFDPKVTVPIATTFGRYPGQETSIDKLCDLILWMHTKVPFYLFTTDTYQSFAIKQKLVAAEINAQFLSVDRTTQHYKTAKQMIYSGKAKLPKNELLKNELLHLLDLGDKVDHHQELNINGDIGSNSKDCADAVAGLLSSMHNANEEAMQPPIITNSMYESYTEEYMNLYFEKMKKRRDAIIRKNLIGI